MRVCVVSSGLKEANRRLQPWRYLLEVADALTHRGHDVLLVSNERARMQAEGKLQGLRVIRVPVFGARALPRNRDLLEAVLAAQPDAVLLHVGMTSFLHLGIVRQLPAPVFALFTSPIYRSGELLHLGLWRLVRGGRLSAAHILGLLVPGHLIRRVLVQGTVRCLIVECATTRERVVDRGAPEDHVIVIRPGIDGAWLRARLTGAQRTWVRARYGLAEDDFVVGFFGPPTSLRGLPNLLRAATIARHGNPRIKVLALCRGQARSMAHRAVERLRHRLDAEGWSRLVTGDLPQARLIEAVSACDVVALPFEIVPSDVPLSALEAQAAGVPLITTRVACLPEMVQEGGGLCVPPADAQALAKAMRILASDDVRRKRMAELGRRHAHLWNTLHECDLGELALLGKLGR